MLIVAFVLGACGSDFVPLTVDELTVACIRLQACTPTTGGGVNACLGGENPLTMRLVPSRIRCLAAATTDCASVRACLGESEIVGPCDGQFGYQPMCIGDRMSTCSPNSYQRYSYECSTDSMYAGGPTCIPPDSDGTGSAACGLGRCDRAGERWCEGDVVQICHAASLVLEEYDCARLGMGCKNGGCTSPGGGGPCGTFVTSCVGGDIRRCQRFPQTGTPWMDDFQQDTRYDCAKVMAGSTCYEESRPDGGYPGAYCGFGDECHEGVDHETCDGTRLTYCSAGVFRTIDCTSFGYSMCQAWWPDFTGPYGGRCRNF